MKIFINTKNALSCKTKKGSGLVMALVMIVVVSIILTSLLGYITSQIRFSNDRVERERAFQIAEAGIYYYKWYIAHKLSGKKADEIEAFWKATGAGCPLGVCDDYEADFSDPEDSVVGRYKLEVDVPEDGSTFFTVTSTGWTYKKPTAQRVLQVRFRRPSWSEYIFLSNSFLNFGTAAVVYGKIHSNFGVHFDGTAYNMVSAMPPSFDDPDYGSHVKDFGVYTTRGTDDPKAPDPWVSGTTPPVRSDVFIGGREMDVSGINFTGITTDLSFMKAKASAPGSEFGQYFPKEGVGRKITLKTDGTFDVCTVNAANSSTHAISSSSGYAGEVEDATDGSEGSSCTTGSCCSFSECPWIKNSNHGKGKCVTKENFSIVNNGVIFVEDNIWLEGSLNGKRVSVASGNLSGGGDPTDIYIGISNSNIRLAAYDCNNMLGLVAQRDIRILDDGPNDFIIDAALLAQTGLVGITNGMSGDSITFNGAIASYLQPYFKQGNSGFEDRTYNFNNKLLYCPPPYFPTGTEYSIDQWDEL